MAMNTLAADVRPANPAAIVKGGIASDTRRSFNNKIECWTEDARAKMLLASCASHPPAGEWSKAFHAYGYGEAFRYTGYRAEALTAIRDAYGQRALDAYHARGDAAYPQFDAWCRSISANDAIDAAADVLAVQMEG